MKLSTELGKWRCDRPDEWKMGEFQRNAERLEADRDAFASRLEDAEEQYSELHDINTELAAQVSRLQTFIKKTCEKWGGVPELEPTVWNLQRAASESPAACLAQVRAEAIDDVWKKLHHRWKPDTDGDSAFVRVSEIKEMAERIRQEVK
jgi:hypothetical protein